MTCFIAVVWNQTCNISEICLYLLVPLWINFGLCGEQFRWTIVETEFCYLPKSIDLLIVNYFCRQLIRLNSNCFPYSSVGKESACKAKDPGLIPGSGRSAGEGIGYPLQYSWASLVNQLVKNPPAMQETWIRFLGWEDLEKGKATHSSILAWRIPWTV